ncbi:hypothetical protein [Streptomyces sp. NPDC057257]|uniref:hypothetical protein n=1 Tax=Streptomyces sp. NPDC057257 TaxID=3346071 RepID=UPI00362555CD
MSETTSETSPGTAVGTTSDTATEVMVVTPATVTVTDGTAGEEPAAAGPEETGVEWAEAVDGGAV